ncbi:LAFE_0E01816g1_1 [Lachancea fermentati]|uniref:LAFE_0E01816g1_1 n=1 Tax=Lachancea fermentati TaxID=4955 RepID=A0A1G4MCN1_LACFM|nr:LAFE_0E01816g1_1 [Lachancea fermentati]
MNRIELVFCLVSLALTLFLAALDIVIVITLYDTIGEKFKSYDSIGWLVTGYSLPNALFTLLWGRLAALFGLKTSLIVSIVIFEIGSLIVAVADSMGMLIGGRVVAGCGGSGIQSLVFVVGTSLVQERNRGFVITVLGFAFAIAFAVGPVIGGALTEDASWRWCFFINLPIGGLALAMLAISYRPTDIPLLKSIKENLIYIKDANYRQMLTLPYWKSLLLFYVFELDFVGFALSSTGFVLFMLGFTFGGNEHSWYSGTIIAYVTVGGCLIFAFAFYDFVVLRPWGKRYGIMEAKPLLDWSSCSILGLWTSSFALFFCCFAFNMQTVYVVQFFQLVFNKGPTAASMHLWGFLIPTMVSIVVLGKVSNVTGYVKPAIVAGAICGVVGSGLLTLQNNHSTTGQTIGYTILPGIAFGSIMQNTLLSAQIQIEYTDPEFHRKFIEVTALNTFAKALGMSFGGIIATMIFTNSVKNQLISAGLQMSGFTNVEDLIASRAQNYDGKDSQISVIIARAIRNVFYAALGCYALSFLFSIFTSNKRLIRPPKSEDLEQSYTEKTQENSLPGTSASSD